MNNDASTQQASTETQQRRASRMPWILSAVILLIVAVIAITYGYSSKPLSSIAAPNGVDATQQVESTQDQ